MSQQATMTMASMGGPVNAINANTPNHAANANTDSSEYVKRLNTYIYDYFMRNRHYDCARVMLAENLPIGLHNKSSPSQRQANGVEDADMERDAERPKDLPMTDLPAAGGHFLEDWWFQFWDVFNSRRSGHGKPSTIAYLTHQRQLQKARSGMTADPSAQQRNYNMINGQAADLKKVAMVNNGNMNPQAMAAMRAAHQLQQRQQQQQQQQQQLQAGQMERSASQMDAHSGSPGSGGAPSPKRPRVDGNMQPMGQQRPGQPGQMPTQVGHTSDQPPPDPNAHAHTRALMLSHNIDPNSIDPASFNTLAMQPTNHQLKSLESYNSSMQQQMTHAIKQAQASSNVTKGMSQNAVAGTQGTSMPPGGMDVMALENGLRPGMMPNNGVNMSAQGGANNNGSHALQDYQMQLMLLEQQNKRRLQMARSDQETMNGHTGVPAANGQFAPNMSPSGRGASPNPNDMSRGTPKMNNGPSPNGLAGRGSPVPGYDPNALLAQQRNQMMVLANGQLIPRSNPMNQAQMDMMRAAQMSGQLMPNGAFLGGPGMPPNMMSGQPGPQPGQVPPNMTPRQGNMAPPPAPQPNAAGTQPSSPAPAPAPPTPSQSTKGKPGGKKDGKAGKGSNKKNANATAATPASEAEQPPTPTPQTPLANAKSFNQNQAVALAHSGLTNGHVNSAQVMQQGIMQVGQPDMSGAPFSMDGSEPFSTIADFGNDGQQDVLDNFDFDAFLQNTGDDGGMQGFDYDFSVGGVEAGDGFGP